jgi:hypothetical protein
MVDFLLTELTPSSSYERKVRSVETLLTTPRYCSAVDEGKWYGPNKRFSTEPKYTFKYAHVT